MSFIKVYEQSNLIELELLVYKFTSKLDAIFDREQLMIKVEDPKPVFKFVQKSLGRMNEIKRLFEELESEDFHKKKIHELKTEFFLTQERFSYLVEALKEHVHQRKLKFNSNTKKNQKIKNHQKNQNKKNNEKEKENKKEKENEKEKEKEKNKVTKFFIPNNNINKNYPKILLEEEEDEEEKEINEQQLKLERKKRLEEQKIVIEEKNKRVKELQNDIADLSQMMFVFAQEVSVQNQQIETIQDYINQAQVNIEEGTQDIVEAGLSAWKILLPLSGVLVGGLVGGIGGGLTGLKVGTLISSFQFGGIAGGVIGGFLGYGANTVRKNKIEKIKDEVNENSKKLKSKKEEILNEREEEDDDEEEDVDEERKEKEEEPEQEEEKKKKGWFSSLFSSKKDEKEKSKKQLHSKNQKNKTIPDLSDVSESESESDSEYELPPLIQFEMSKDLKKRKKKKN
ncbi:syntaxin-17 [Anaeramoeba flamelloides]|uniref:Syntaxin-17 n=1 Tax=Anaeramoeba flamelloides TaxID=1746091 RepID=A0ABQ8ZAI3_9EUKA|nr:syntaxin-17 [Anaeramoeba flamelloides]